MILFEDDHWLCLNKRAHLPTTPPTRRGKTLLDYAKIHRPKALFHHPLSRLDADVTGLVVFALTAHANATAERVRTEGNYHRTYVGITSPSPHEDQDAWTWDVSIDPQNATLRTTSKGREPQHARTEYCVIARATSTAWVHFKPVTGRTHQIRVHSRAAGTPLVGDSVYGGARRITDANGAVCSAERVMLHAWRVVIPGSERVVEAPIGDDMRTLWIHDGGDVSALG
jgi:23S rRNA pseudouridine1911/1915/1917 synthase